MIAYALHGHTLL